MTKKTMYLPAVFALLLVVATAMIGAFDLLVQKWAALGALAIMIALLFLPKAKLVFKTYTTPLFIALTGYVIWNGVSMFYADVPKAALFEFTKLIVAFAVFLAVLFFTLPTKRGFKITSGVLSFTAAVFGIISIDAASNGPIAGAFKGLMGLFTESMQSFGGFENGIRMSGIFGNANTFAGFMALGVLLSLALVLNSESKKARIVSVSLLAINSLSYILLFSLGSLFMFLVACILMIAASKKGEKLSTFILMVGTAVITLVFTAVSLISMGTSPWIPLAALVLNCSALWVFDTYVRRLIASKLASNTKGGTIAGLIVTVLFLGYVVAALNVTGPLTLAPSETVMRGVYPAPGEYMMSYTMDGNNTNPNVRITSQNMTDLKVHTSTELYNGSIDTASFTVPEDSEIVKVYFTGSNDGNTISGASLQHTANSSAAPTEIKLDYKLLPAIAANRIQDLRANENSVQRIVFFQDGMKLFKQSPIIGHGLSGYEIGVPSVQEFFYETRYVHNHYIQALCDLGIIGFMLFISVLVLCVLPLLALFKQSKKSGYTNGGAFALPVLAACTLQIFGQALTDLTWSAGPFLLIAFGVMALLIICTSKAFNTAEVSDDVSTVFNGTTASEDKNNTKKTDGKNLITGAAAARLAVIAVTCVMTVLLTLNLYAHYKAASGNCTMDQMAQLTKLDKFEGDDYKTSYIVTATTYGLTENFEQANKFATELTSNSDVVLNYLLPYYFMTNQDDKLFETASIAAHKGKASPYIWNSLFDIFASAIETDREDPVPILLHLFGNKEYYIDGLLGYYRDLQERNDAYLDDAMLDASNVVFIGKLLGIEDLDKSSLIEAMDVFSKIIFDSKFSVDADGNWIPDNVAVLSGSTSWGHAPKKPERGSCFDGTMAATAGTSIEVEAYCVRGGEYTFRLHGLTGLDGIAAPRDLTAVIDGVPATVEYDEGGAFIKVKLRGAVEADEAKSIVASPASTEKITITFPTGGQMTSVTLTR